MLFNIVWLLLILCIIVVVHEGGHALVARLCGMRVSEFFIGMPLGPEFSRTSKRSGIRYGCTLAFFGGYTRICGMAYLHDERSALALELVNVRGVLETGELSEVLKCDYEEAARLLLSLADLGSVEPVYARGTRMRRGEIPYAFRTPARDATGLTIRDRHNRIRQAVAHPAATPYFCELGADEFLGQEVGRTYSGASFPRKVAVLIAGVCCNLLLAYILILFYLMAQTFYTISPNVYSVQEDSPAALAGMVAGDEIVGIDDFVIDDYYDLDETLAGYSDSDTFVLSYMHDGQVISAQTSLQDGLLGVTYTYVDVHLSLAQANSVVIPYIAQVAAAISQLLIPTQAQEVLSESSGIVGITYMTGYAVSIGPLYVILLIGMLSLSLGWMNLLPIPPLDGGKLLIEIIQRIMRRPVPVKIQNAVSLAGMFFFALLFLYLVFQDIGRYF